MYIKLDSAVIGYSPMAGFCKRDNIFGFHKRWGTFDLLSNCQLLKKNSAPWN
jgi:hypothetical protein